MNAPRQWPRTSDLAAIIDRLTARHDEREAAHRQAIRDHLAEHCQDDPRRKDEQ